MAVYIQTFWLTLYLLPLVASIHVHNTTTTNSTQSPLSKSTYIGKKMQATVTGYGECLTQAMACGLSGSPGKDPTAAMSGYLIPHNDGVCGTCWQISAIRSLDYFGSDVPPKIGKPFDSDAEGMVVLVNNACAPGKDQYRQGAVGQCAQNTKGVGGTDRLGSETVLDLCTETEAVTRMWNSTKAGMVVADVVGVPCSEWSGTIRKVAW